MKLLIACSVLLASVAPQADAPRCGDGVKEAGEECDDGNLLDRDSCDSTCHIERVCCCGTGSIDPGEECDDGNDIDDDGCSMGCKIDPMGRREPRPEHGAAAGSWRRWRQDRHS